MKILVISSLFPNNKQLTNGVFVKQQILELSKLCALKVVAPVPFSLPIKQIKKWDTFAHVSKKEIIYNIEAYHPRYFVTPKIGRCLYGFFYFMGIYKTVKNILKNFKFNFIVVYFAYPDGFAAALLAKILKKPLIIYALGSDINVFLKSKIRKFLTRYALNHADSIITVSNNLKVNMERLGIPEKKIVVIHNGVDSLKFIPMSKNECRRKLNIPLNKSIILFIGSLRRVKGAELLIEALKKLKDYGLNNLLAILIGDGELKEEIENKIKINGLNHEVRLVGAKSHEEIPFWMNACDVFCLPSLSEGYPNVVLESLACGKPVVSTTVGGIPEIITSEDYGFLVSSQNTHKLAEALQKAIDKTWNCEVLRNRVSGSTWKENSKKLYVYIRKNLRDYKEKISENNLPPSHAM